MKIEIGTECHSKNGKMWTCIAKADGFVWMRHPDNKSGTAYVWTEGGKSVSLCCANSDYDIRPEPVVETVTLWGWANKELGFIFATRSTDRDTHRITFTVTDGEPATGTFTNENGDVIKMERLND